MDLNDRREEFVQKIREALEEALGSSSDIHDILNEIREEGFDLQLGIAIMMTLIPRDGSTPSEDGKEENDADKDGAGKEAGFLQTDAPLEPTLTARDINFLKSLNIDIHEVHGKEKDS